MSAALRKRITRRPDRGAEDGADMVTCPECHGEGVVYASYDAYTDDRHYFVMGACPICDGGGKIRKTNKSND